MTFIRVQAPLSRSSARGGISFSLVARKDGTTVALINMSGAWQKQFFGESVAGRRFDVLHGRGDDEGLLRLVLLPQGAEEGVAAIRSARSGARLTLRSWDLLGREPQRAQPCRVMDHDASSVTLRLPDWCSQKERKTREAAEVIPPLKPVPRRGEE